MIQTDFSWQTKDGLQIYARDWQPEEKTRAVVCLVHGLGEHSGRYQHLAEKFTESGFAVVAFDLRGHGKSKGRRGHVPDFVTLMDDIEQFLQETEKRYPGMPRFLYGHSLGGSLVIDAVLTTESPIVGVISTGPPLRLAFKPPAWKITLGNLIDRVWPSFSMSNGLERAALSRDPEVVRAYETDPLVHDRISARLATVLFQGGELAMEHADELPVPMLLMYGGADRITSVQAGREFTSLAGSRCMLKEWDYFYHEIHNEPEKDQVFAYTLGWMEAILEVKSG